jgi:preflagellin peptidase FlaK
MALGEVLDVVRLFVLPVFAWLGYIDVKTRRIPNKYWPPLFGGSAVLLLIEVVTQSGVVREMSINLLFGVGIVIPCAYLLWLFGGIGGADVKGIALLVVLFPETPVYQTAYATYPVIDATTGGFIISVVVNTLLLFICIPVVLTIVNAISGEVSRYMPTGVMHDAATVTGEQGVVLLTDSEKHRQGVNIDVVTSYLDWRDASIEEISRDSCAYRHPGTSPTEGEHTRTDYELEPADENAVDWWCAEEFTTMNNHTDVSPPRLRETFEELVNNNSVWVTPTIPVFVIFALAIPITLVIGNTAYLVL